MTRALLRAAALLIPLVLFLGTGEAALRVVYRDAGRRTLGGPGGRAFDHLTVGPEELRGRRDTGPRRDGVPRLMVIGDSITYGQGVHDWHDVWPERLATKLEGDGRPQEMAVFALPGRDIPQHLAELERWGRVVAPDVLIYQWYVNDIEVMSHRPDGTHGWQRWSGHDWLRRRSYLYYFLDNRIGQFVPAADRSYIDYILQDFGPGSAEWTEFERVFHAFATEAKTVAPRRLMLLYPQVPYGDVYALQPVHDRMKGMSAPHVLAIPPVAWVRSGGSLQPDPSAPWHQSLHVAPAPGPLVETREYVVIPGALQVELTLASQAPADAPALGTIEAFDAASNQILAAAPVAARGGTADWQEVDVPLTIPGTAREARRVRLRVVSAGRAAWKLASIGVRVDYGFEVLDLAEPLNKLNTHASIFDAHPNAAAHAVIAEEVYRVLK